MIHEDTMEEKAYERLLDEKHETLSDAARGIIGEALTAAYAHNLVHNYAYQPEECEEAMERMRLAATRITQRDRDILAKIVRAGYLAAVSIDPDDKTPVWYRANRGYLHWYYKMSSGMIDEILEERVLEPIQQDEGEWAHDEEW